MFHANIELNKFIELIGSKNNWYTKYKVCFSKMLSITGERTLQPAILAPNISHVNGVISVSFEKEEDIIELAGLSSSIIIDFYIKTLGKGNLYDDTLKNLLLGIDEKFKKKLFIRTLLLNCINKFYDKLYESNWQEEYKNDNWSNQDCRMKLFNELKDKWSWETPLRNLFERRWALVEIDVIVSFALGLKLNDLVLIYEVQFPVLQQNEDDTWYDQKGNIVFTCSKGLIGVGLDRPEWEKITEEVNPMQRKLKDGDTYVQTIIKSELYNGQEITYYAPFDKCDRVEDYKTAWIHFEKIFSSEIKEKESSIKK